MAHGWKQCPQVWRQRLGRRTWLPQGPLCRPSCPHAAALWNKDRSPAHRAWFVTALSQRAEALPLNAKGQLTEIAGCQDGKWLSAPRRPHGSSGRAVLGAPDQWPACGLPRSHVLARFWTKSGICFQNWLPQPSQSTTSSSSARPLHMASHVREDGKAVSASQDKNSLPVTRTTKLRGQAERRDTGWLGTAADAPVLACAGPLGSWVQGEPLPVVQAWRRAGSRDCSQ